MKKIAKVWVLWFAFASSVVALLVSATPEFTSQVTLTLTEWDNTCILSDYIFTPKQASPTDQLTESMWQLIDCTFLKNNQINVSLHMSDLTGSADVSIPASWFSWYITSGNTRWSIVYLDDKNLGTLDNQPIIYTKLKNTVWEWTWTLTLQWVIPWWTPGGSYTWTIDIVLDIVP